MRFAFLLIFLLAGYTSQAQLFTKDKVLNKENFDKRRWSWGYFLGTSRYDFQIKYKEEAEDINVTPSVGFNVGLIGNLKINQHFDLRLEPGIVFSNRDLSFPNFDNENDSFREVKSSYIHVPLLLKFSAKRINNFKPFLVAGAAVSQNLSSQENNPQDNSAGQFRLKTQNYYYEVGFGIDFYFDYFKFTPSIRGVFGMNDELVRDEDPNSPWTSNIESLKTRGLFLNFTFQ